MKSTHTRPSSKIIAFLVWWVLRKDIFFDFVFFGNFFLSDFHVVFKHSVWVRLRGSYWMIVLANEL